MSWMWWAGAALLAPLALDYAAQLSAYLHRSHR